MFMYLSIVRKCMFVCYRVGFVSMHVHFSICVYLQTKFIFTGIFLEKLLRGGKIEIFVSKGGHACVRVHTLIVCVPVLIINVCVPA